MSDCKAYNRKCYKCGNYGHYAQFRKSVLAKQREENLTEINTINEDTLEMPYFEIDNTELIKTIHFNSRQMCFVAHLEREYNKFLENCKHNGQKEVEKIEQENESLHKDNKVLMKDLSNLIQTNVASDEGTTFLSPVSWKK